MEKVIIANQKMKMTLDETQEFIRGLLKANFNYVICPFDRILDYVEAGKVLEGENAGQEVAAGLIIHEGQLTYMNQGLKLIVDTGVWWMEQTGFPLPLGANGIRRDLGPENIHEVNRLLKASIQYGLDHRKKPWSTL